MLEAFELLAPYFMFVIGAYMGSFAYVIILRWPAGQPFMISWSYCPHCEKDLAWYDNIPLFSWLFLKGRCRSCYYKIPLTYFSIELLMALLFLNLYWHIGFKWLLIEYAFVLFGLITITVIDFKHYLIPDILTLPGICFGLIGAALNPERAFLGGFAGFLLGGGFFWLISWVYFVLRRQEGLGGGDIKLLAWIGAVLGWKSIPVIILISSLSGILVGLLMLPLTSKGFQTAIPYGPFLAGAALFYMFGGDQWTLPYLQWLFPGLF